MYVRPVFLGINFDKLLTVFHQISVQSASLRYDTFMCFSSLFSRGEIVLLLNVNGLYQWACYEIVI